MKIFWYSEIQQKCNIKSYIKLDKGRLILQNLLFEMSARKGI